MSNQTVSNEATTTAMIAQYDETLATFRQARALVDGLQGQIRASFQSDSQRIFDSGLGAWLQAFTTLNVNVESMGSAVDGYKRLNLSTVSTNSSSSGGWASSLASGQYGG